MIHCKYPRKADVSNCSQKVVTFHRRLTNPTPHKRTVQNWTVKIPWPTGIDIRHGHHHQGPTASIAHRQKGRGLDAVSGLGVQGRLPKESSG